MKISIRLKLIGFTLCVVLLVGGTISFYSIYQLRQRILATFEKEIKDMTAIMSTDIANELYFLNLSSLRLRLENIRLDPDFTYIYVTDLEGVVLADGTLENPLRDQKLSDAFSKKIMLSNHWISTVDDGILKSGRPIVMADGSRLGYLLVGFSLEGIYQIISDTTRTNLIITLLSLGIGTLLAVILSTSFTQPILAIVDASRKIGAGKLDSRLNIKRKDELGTLADSINQMANNLKANVERIRALHEINLATTSTLDLHNILDALLEKLDRSLPYPTVIALRILNQETRNLEVAAFRNIEEEEWEVPSTEGERGLTRAVLEDRAPVVVIDASKHPRTRRPDFLNRHHLVSYLGVPLITKEDLLGDIAIFTKEEHAFSPEEIEFVAALASQAAIAIQNSRLYEETKRQARELEKANQMKDEFLGIMSHELRTPINVIMGYSGVVKDGIMGEINEMQEEALGKVMGRAQDLLNLVNQILQATSIQAGAAHVEKQDISLQILMDEIKASYDFPQEKDITLNWDCDSNLPKVQTDGQKLKHILHNLVNNALKFTDQGHITISARYIPELRQAEFTVKDTGIGIDRKMLPLVFEMFRQVDGTGTRTHGGVGIGLYIVKQYTELLGGKVEVESESGKGSTFTVTIPC